MNKLHKCPTGTGRITSTWLTSFEIEFFVFLCRNRLDRKTKIQCYNTEFLEIAFHDQKFQSSRINTDMATRHSVYKHNPCTNGIYGNSDICAFKRTKCCLRHAIVSVKSITTVVFSSTCLIQKENHKLK